ncbi:MULTISPECIES: hypothetical protein [Mesobacillus]|uniref:Membrane protein YqaA with SNARE-associated domain n=1 Tax=Mesobacillus stamsii TaxID=225347 RepID=A0ABU0G135_9BACI|nr:MULTISPECIES: hypothetical protein [Mesobacillus]MDQ0415287.1 membrane protein YqaA with SNARE-associated domain [Mesobacillus stamsii]
MIISAEAFNILIWVSIVGSGSLMFYIFGYFLYELKRKKIW